MADSIAKTYQRCRHFNGVQHETCGAGVKLATVRYVPEKGMARWPCLQLIGCAESPDICPQRSNLSPVELAEEDHAFDQAVTAAVASIAAGKCHECGAAIEPSRVVGRCRYAACGHRVGQVDSEETPW